MNEVCEHIIQHLLWMKLSKVYCCHYLVDQQQFCNLSDHPSHQEIWKASQFVILMKTLKMAN